MAIVETVIAGFFLFLLLGIMALLSSPPSAWAGQRHERDGRKSGV